MFMRQSGIWPILCQLMAILAKLLDMDFKFVLPIIYINFDIQTNQTQIGHSIPKITLKVAKMAISQNPILPKCYSPKKPTPTFSINLSETLRINVNMDFAHNNRGLFLIKASKKNLGPKSKKKRVPPARLRGYIYIYIYIYTYILY